MATLALDRLDTTADTERLHAAMGRWRRRSHMIRFFRRALPAAMILLLLAVFGWAGWKAFDRPEQAGTSVSVRMLNPKFRGRDSKGRAYVLSAAEAARDSRNFQRVLLTKPALVLEPGGDSKPLRVRAETGVYNERTLVMTLEGKVHVEDPSGWIFDTEKAVVDTRKDTISGDSDIVGVGPMGRIAAARYVIYNQGERITLYGKGDQQVRTTLNR